MRSSFAETLEEACNKLAAAKKIAEAMAKSWPDDKTMRLNRKLLADAKKQLKETAAALSPKRKKI